VKQGFPLWAATQPDNEKSLIQLLTLGLMAFYLYLLKPLIVLSLPWQTSNIATLGTAVKTSLIFTLEW
jgi:hypothetical protein